MKHFISAVIKCQKQMASGKAAFGHLKYHITCVGGIVVSIAAFQAVDPGSIPGQRNEPFLDAAVQYPGRATSSHKNVVCHTTFKWEGGILLHRY